MKKKGAEEARVCPIWYDYSSKIRESERARRDAENAQQAQRVQEQLEMMRNLVERSVNRDSGTTATASKEKIILTKLGENEDIEAYLTTFERLMTVYGVAQERWAVKLAPQLTRRVQQAYTAMATADAGVYSEVKKAILRRYDISEETYRQRFRAARKKDGEAYIELATRLADLFKKWTVDCSTVEAVAEKMLTEQLLNAMPEDLRVWLSEKKPTTVAEAGRLADDYVLARKRNRVGASKQSGNREIGGSREGGGSRETRTCHECGQRGHLARNCAKRNSSAMAETEPQGERTREERSEKKCYNCKQRGHIARYCPSALYCGGVVGIGSAGVVDSVGDGMVTGEMSGCAVVRDVTGDGMAAVVSEGCVGIKGPVGVGSVGVPVEPGCIVDGVSVHRPGVVEGTRVPDVVLDTGCSRTMVRDDLVPEERRVAGEAITLRCAHGDSVVPPG